ncbi:MAG: hypothetical protein PUD17_04215 [Treponema sp.]|uniref:hypothetical protein n=1 Tax=Treponema sp. TaxID=166 RepID=UPI00298E4E5F|nr:hypothetical protein [Treponema sp.]MDD5811289.1 hypothetical protein [Treponema sp.]
MKKFLSIIAAAFVLSTAVFAKDSYEGDIQLHFGFSTDNFNIINSVPNAEDNIYSGLFDFEIATTHVWGENSVVKVGFTVDFNSGIGGTINASSNVENNRFALKYDLFVGPTFAFTLGNVVRLDVTPGVSLVGCDFFFYFDNVNDNFTTLGTSAIGPGAEVKIKFAPSSRFSPVVGFRFAASFSSFLVYGSSENKPVDNLLIFTNTWFLGFGWNW